MLRTCSSSAARVRTISGFYKHDAPPELEIEGGSGHNAPPTPAPEGADICSRGCNPRIRCRHSTKPQRGGIFKNMSLLRSWGYDRDVGCYKHEAPLEL